MKKLLNQVILLLFVILIFNLSMDASVDMLKIRMAVSDDIVSSTSIISSTQSQVEIASPTATDNERFKARAYFSPKSNRDPFLSPVEYEQIRLMQEQKRREEEERRQAMLGQFVEKKKKEDPLKKYKLQGIVGKYAIINGEMVQEGRSYKKDFTLLKVYTDYVIIRYNGKNYKLVLK